MPATRVIHIKSGEQYDFYIGRGPRDIGLGNPFSHKDGTLAKYKVETRDEAIACYEEWVQTQPQILEMIPNLQGKVLACWCRPPKGFQGRVLCHGQILAALADGIAPEGVE